MSDYIPNTLSDYAIIKELVYLVLVYCRNRLSNFLDQFSFSPIRTMHYFSNLGYHDFKFILLL